MTEILIYIPSKLSGGGRRQLQEVCDVLTSGGGALSIASPGNCDFELKGEIQFLQLSGCRLLDEVKLACLASSYDRVFCYSNLPALFVSANKQIIFLQNRLLVDSRLLFRRTCKLSTRLFIQRVLLRVSIGRCAMVVQGATIAYGLRKLGQPVSKIFFLKAPCLTGGSEKKSTGNVFFYPTSDEPHKNIARLLCAWDLLSSCQVSARLIITVSSNAYSASHNVFASERYQSQINFTGALAEEDISAIWQTVDFCIYPSLSESYGYAIDDALKNNVPMVSSEAAYIKERVAPLASFDPLCELSIAYAIVDVLGLRDVFIARLTEGIYPLGSLVARANLDALSLGDDE